MNTSLRYNRTKENNFSKMEEDLWGDTQQEVKRKFLFVKPACCVKWSMLIQTEYDRNETPRAKLAPGATPVTQRQMILFHWTYARSELDPQHYAASNSTAKKPEIHHGHPNGCCGCGWCPSMSGVFSSWALSSLTAISGGHLSHVFQNNDSDLPLSLWKRCRSSPKIQGTN